MKLELTQQQITETEERGRVKQRAKCPCCGSRELLVAGPDQFCCECDWSTCFEYVELGLMNNLQAAYFEHFNDAPSDSKIETQETKNTDLMKIA